MPAPYVVPQSPLSVSSPTIEPTSTGKKSKKAKLPKAKSKHEENRVDLTSTISPSRDNPSCLPVTVSAVIPNLFTNGPVSEHYDHFGESAKSVSADIEIQYLKKQLSEMSRLLTQEQSKSLQIPNSSSVTSAVTPQPEANTATFAMPPPQAGAGYNTTRLPLQPNQSESTILMKPSAVQPTENLHPAPARIYQESNFWQYNYMMQLQRDSIRAQVDRDVELERSKEYKVKAQELLIQQSIAAHFSMFGQR
jgi:hypothetical protein